jgi:tetratricopeptide (TPR) repeat protein
VNRRVLLVAAPLVLIGIAGTFVYRSLVVELRGPVRADGTRPGDETSAAVAPQSESETQAVVEPGAVRTPLWLIPGAGGRPLVALGSPEWNADRPGPREIRQGILARELVRQAVLIAARDELGLSTRDQVLGDQAASGQGIDRVELAMLMAPEGRSPNRFLVRRIAGDQVESLLDRELLDANDSPDNLAKLAEVAEAMSRNELPGVLKKLRLEGKPNSLRTEGDLPGELEQRLSGLSFTELFSAVRDVHAAIRADGESPARLGALIRGYAVLGLLTEFQWHPAHKAFKARALLYAQRLVARDPNVAWGYWHRAHARALAGLHKDALGDLALAAERARTAGNKTPPEWVDLIDACARCDSRRLQAAANGGPRAKLAALLFLTSVEYPTMPSLTLQAADQVVELEPDCFRAIDAMCRVQGVANMHIATLLGPRALEELLPVKLRAVSALPAQARNVLDNPAVDESMLNQALAKAGEAGVDTGEPSWNVLGHMIRETRFVAVMWRLIFMRYMWGVPVDEFWAESKLAVVDHPVRPLLETIASNPSVASQSMSTVVDQLDMANLEITEFEMVRLISRFAAFRSRTVWNAAMSHSDQVAGDLSFLVYAPAGRETAVRQPEFARALLAVSPHSPGARALLIEKDWNGVKGELAQWEKEGGDAPAVLAALARHYSADKNYAEAGKYLARYIEHSPDSWAFELLAKNYKDQGDLKGWQETLDKYLANTEDSGLEHARIRVEIAKHYMGKKQWDEAWPYAEAAAQTGAAWAMACAQRCAEGREDWDQALVWAQRESERYPESSWWKWFLFCKRTGKGDVKAAQGIADQTIRTSAQNDSVGWFYWICHDRDKAIAYLRHVYVQNPSAEHCNTLITAADDLGDTNTREEFYRIFDEKFKDKVPKGAKIWEIFHAALESKEKPAIDINAVDSIVQSIAAERRWYTELYVGVFLTNHGTKDDAQRYLESVKAKDSNPWRRALIGDCLTRLGVDPTRTRSQPPVE